MIKDAKIRKFLAIPTKKSGKLFHYYLSFEIFHIFKIESALVFSMEHV